MIFKEEMKAFCFKNGLTEEDIKKLIDGGLTEEDVYNSVCGLIEKGEPLNNENIYMAKLASAFGDDKTEFVWFPYIPKGDYTVLMADGGTGKTILCCGIIANLSNGEPLPDNSRTAEPCKTLIISAEDRGELLKRRLLASKADLNEVYILDCKDSAGLNFTDKYSEFSQLLKHYEPKLVIVDPWHAFLGADVDINRVNAVRPVFQSLANLAKECNCGLILVSHVNKRAQGENANNAATGSTDFINAARSAIRVIFSDEQGEEDTRILVHTKSNYAAAGKSVKYRINENGGCSWAGFSEITRQTLEDAARHRKKPNELLNQRQAQEEINFALIEAIKEHAKSGETVNISYDQMRDEHGIDIFEDRQPKRELERLSAKLLEQHGIKLTLGKLIKYQGKPRNGFSIYKTLEFDSYLEDLEEF